MTGNSNDRKAPLLRHPAQADGASPRSQSGIEQQRPSLDMSVIAGSAPPVHSLFDRRTPGGLELPPLKQSFTYHGMAAPNQYHSTAYDRSPGSTSGDGQKKRKIGHLESGASAPAALSAMVHDPKHITQPQNPPALSPPSQPLALNQSAARPSFLSRSPNLDSQTLGQPPSGPYPYDWVGRPPSPQRSQKLTPIERYPTDSQLRGLPLRQTDPHVAHRDSSESRNRGDPRVTHSVVDGSINGQRHSFHDHSRQSLSHAAYSVPNLHGTTIDGQHTPAHHRDVSERSTSPRSHTQSAHLHSIPVATTGAQNTYQMMTLQTSTGAVQVPVDVQAASRVADEKRRRNAGASARFRERRKKKEIEASATIRKLEQQVKDMSEDVHYYRQERDYFVSAVLQGPGGDRHFPRPLNSPRLRRKAPPASLDGSATSDGGYDYGEDAVDGAEDDPRMRTRASSFSHNPDPSSSRHPGSHGHSMSTTPFATYANQASAYPPPNPYPQADGNAAVASRQSALTDGVSLQPQRGQLPSIHTLPPPVMQASPTTGPYNPYAGQRIDRLWPQGAPRPSARDR